MKKIMVFMIIGSVSFGSHAQSRISVMIQQVTANAAVMSDIKKGISIARDGLDFIGQAKNGEFSLHQLFFGSLKSINPKIAGWTKIADIITLELQLLKNYKAHFKNLQDSRQFSPSEMNYMLAAFSKLTDQGAAELEELISIITADKYQMSDDERMHHIEKLHRDMQSDYDFEQHFSDEALILALQRKQEANEVENSTLLYGIK